MKHSKKIHNAWQVIAEEFSLQMEPRRTGLAGLLHRHKMEGTIDTRRVRVDICTEGSGKHKKTYTRFRVDFCRPLGIGLAINTEAFLFSSVAKKFGSQDIQTGDARFDKKFMIKGNQEYQVMSYLNHTRKEAVYELFEKSRPKLDDEGIESRLYGIVYETDRFRDQLSGLLKIAGKLDQ